MPLPWIGDADGDGAFASNKDVLGQGPYIFATYFSPNSEKGQIRVNSTVLSHFQQKGHTEEQYGQTFDSATSDRIHEATLP